MMLYLVNNNFKRTAINQKLCRWKFIHGNLNLQCVCISGWGLWEVLWEHSALMMEQGSLYEETWESLFLFSVGPHEDTGRWEVCVNQGAGSHQTLHLLVLWPWTSQPLEPWERNICCPLATLYDIFVVMTCTDQGRCIPMEGTLGCGKKRQNPGSLETFYPPLYLRAWICFTTSLACAKSLNLCLHTPKVGALVNTKCNMSHC